MAPNACFTLGLLAIALTALVAPPAAAQAEAACGQPLAVADPADDQTLWPVVVAPGPVRRPELDVQATTLTLEGDEVVLTATLGAVPTADVAAYSYRYWFGFHVKPAGGEPEYMDVRMHGKGDLAGAHLITSNERGLERIATPVPQWNGTTATFRFPFALLTEVYGSSDIAIGQPHASTDGPFSQETLMWFATGVAYQVDHAPDDGGAWLAYTPCPPAPAASLEPAALGPAAEPAQATPGPEADASPRGAPGLGVAALGAALVALAARRRLP